MKSAMIILFGFLAGCSSLDTEYKCFEGDVYIRFNGAWIESKAYANNKCLEIK